MRRHAHTGFIAMYLCGIYTVLLFTQPTTFAQTATATNRVYLPLIMKPGVLPTSYLTAVEQEAVTLINQKRKDKGCPPVVVSNELSIAAKAHSKDMGDRNYFDHESPEGKTFVERAEAAKYTYDPSGEIIAGGYSTASGVVDGWMKSSGHRAIIETCANDDIGIGMYYKSGSTWRYYWTAVFGRR